MAKKVNKSGQGKKDYRDMDDRNSQRGKRYGKRSESDKPTSARDWDRRDHGLNDFSWYNQNPILTRAAANIPFPYRPGMWVPLGEQKDGSLVRYHIPGTLAIGVDFSIGYNESVTDPASLAAKEMYGKVREAFSGTLPEDAPDLMIYVLAMDSIYSAIGEMKRFYRVINTYSPFNYTIPESLLKAMCGDSVLDLKIIEEERVDFLDYINQLIGMVTKFTVPSVMHILNRHYWISDNVYADAPTPMAQMYVFRPINRWIFELDTEGKGSLKRTDPKVSPVKFNFHTTGWSKQWYENVRAMIEALANSEDAYTINGHLMRAYQGSPMFTVDALLPNETFVPVYVPEVLAQIENCVPVALSTNNNTSITQNPNSNALVSRPQAVYAESAMDYNWSESIINIHKDDPQLEDIVIASRLIPGLEPNTDSGENFTYKVHSGSEIVRFLAYYGNDDFFVLPNDFTLDLTAATDPNASRWLRYIFYLDAFDWHPIIRYSITTPATPTNNINRGIYGDIYNLTSVSWERMKQINRVALFSEFNAFAQT